MKRFYVTTPIFYVNSEPHIGHACTMFAADTLARFHRLLGERVFFLTGTDEHGTKISQSAESKGLSSKIFCDTVARVFKETWEELDISNDYFIRTTNPLHEDIVKEFVGKMYANGDIYKSRYSGLYCIGCEKFLTETDVINRKCPYHPAEQTIEQEEENWFFKLSKFIPHIINLIENDKTNYIFPNAKRAEILSKLRQGVHDISLSRANVSWGISVPWDSAQTIYVWFDALINYYSAIRFLPNKKSFWPPDVHVVGKEILWFHAVIWPAMLLSSKLPLPKKIFAHSFYTINKQKISKSLRNATSLKTMEEIFGVEGLRYLVLCSFPYRDDSDVDMNQFILKYNADLANGLGNLISRIAKLCEINNFKVSALVSPNFIDGIKDLIDKLKFQEALEVIWNQPNEGVNAINKMINEKEIWNLQSTEAKRELEKIVSLVLNIASSLAPFLPQTSQKIREVFLDATRLEKPLFPRLKEK